MKILVVTGGIGSGKSEVCRILAENGYPLQYNADARAKELYTEHPDLLTGIEKALGVSCRDHDGKFVPSYLARKIFDDKNALEKVEELLFPVLMDDFRGFLSGAEEGRFVVFESATILEKPYFNGFGDKVILVDAPIAVRLDRAAARDGAAKDAVLARMRNQEYMNALSDGAVDARIDYVVINDGTLGQLEDNVKKILKLIND